MNTEEQAIESFIDIVCDNLLIMDYLEETEPGICKFFYERYGIRNFARFNQDFWLGEYRNRERIGSYGLVVYAMSDWNSSSYDERVRKTYDDLHRDISKTHSLKVIEARDVLELAVFLSKLVKYQTKAPDFVVWSGHSSGSDFAFSKEQSKKSALSDNIHYLDTSDFEGEELERIRTYLDLFSSDTVMIFDACSTGEDNSLPVVVARLMGNTFIHPSGKTSVENFGAVVQSNGRVAFNLKYEGDVKSIITHGGITK